jgi:MFS family permease
MNIKRLILATLAIWVFGTVFSMLTCGWLFNWVYQIPPIIWKSPEAIMATPNIVGSYLAGLVISLIFVTIYAMIHKGIPKKGIKKGLIYGFIIYLVGPLSGNITMPYYMTISSVVVGYWLVNMLVTYLLMGLLVGAIYKAKW